MGQPPYGHHLLAMAALVTVVGSNDAPASTPQRASCGADDGGDAGQSPSRARASTRSSVRLSGNSGILVARISAATMSHAVRR